MTRRSGVLIALLAGTPCAAEIGVSEKEIVIGSCSDQEGPTKNRGVEQRESVEAYLDSVNRQGGVHGRKLRLISHDDSYDVSNAPACFDTLMKDGVFMGGFFIGSALGVKYALMAEGHKFPILGINGGPEFLYNPVKRYVFNVRSSYLDQAETPVSHLWEELGIRRIAVAYQDDAYGSAVLEGVGRALKSRGAVALAAASFSRPSKKDETVELGPVIETLKNAQPEAVILGGVGATDAKVIEQARKAGVRAIYVAVTNDPAFYKMGGAVVDGAVMIQPFPPIERKDLPAVAQYTKLLRQRYPKANPTPVGLEAYIDARVIVEAMRKAGREITRENFVDALESMTGLDVGLEDNVGFGPRDHKGLKQAYATVIRGGKPAVLSDWKMLKKD